MWYNVDINFKEVNTYMEYSYQFRIYPTEEQKALMAKTFGCCRYVFNHFLDRRKTTYKETGKGLSYKECSRELTALKKELPWLKEVDSTALQAALRNLDTAYKLDDVLGIRISKQRNGMH